MVLCWPGAHITYYDEYPGARTHVTETVCAVAEAVARFEPVRLLVDEKHLEQANEWLGAATPASKFPIQIHTVATGCPDMWMRDIAPTFTVRDDGVLHGIDFNFNGHGGKISAKSSESLAKTLLEDINIPREASSLTAEGGAIEVDGQGTLMASESSIINDNRNPNKGRETIESELRRVLGIKKFIWVPGATSLDSTDFHIDAVARFARPGVVLFAAPREASGAEDDDDAAWRNAHLESRRVLEKATDAHGRPLELIDMSEPRLERVIPEEATRNMATSEKLYGYRPVFSYVNYLLVDGGVIFPQFGDEEADAAALQTARRVFADREVVPVNATALGIFGGGIHCISQEVPRV